MSKEEFRAIYELTSKREIFLMTDECYCQFVYDAAPCWTAAAPGAKENVVVAGSLSKTYAMTGWRIGFALGARGDYQRHDEVAEPQYIEPNVDCAEGRSGSDAWTAGFG